MAFLPQHLSLHRSTPVWVLVLALGVAPSSGGAQDNAGGTQYQIGVSQGLQWQDRTGPDSGSEWRSVTGLRFGYVTETRTQRLSFGAAGALELSSDRGTQILSDPSLSFDYRREAADTRLELGAFLRRQSLDGVELIADLDDAGDLIIGAIDTTTRRDRIGAQARLEFGRAAPFGGTLRLGQTNTLFSGTTDPDLVDNRQRNAGLDLRFNLSPVMRATTGLDVRQFRETGAATRQTETLSLGIAIDRPDGEYALNAIVALRPEATRYSLVLSRQIVLPDGGLSLRLGVSDIQGGRTRMIGGLDWQRTLPDGEISVGLERNVRGDTRDREVEVNRLTIAGRHDVTPVLSVRASLGLQDSRRLIDGTRTQGSDLSVSLNYALTQDWNLRSGANHSLRREDGATDQSTTTIFLTLDREFLVRR